MTQLNEPASGAQSLPLRGIADIPTSNGAWSGKRGLAAAAVLFAALSLWPLIVFIHPGMQDYPNHLARAFVLLNPDDPILTAHYRTAWEPTPNLAFEMWMMTIGRMMNLDDAGRLCVAFSAIAMIAGTFALAWVLHGRATILQLLAFPLIFNSAFNMGFLSFSISIAFMLFAVAFWEWMGDERRCLRLIGGTVFATMLYLLHFAAFAAYGLYVIGARLRGLSLRNGRRNWALTLHRLFRDAVQALPAAILFLIGRMSPAEVANVDRSIDKFEMPPIRIGQIERLLDVDGPWLNGGMLGLLITFLVFAWIAGRVRLDPKPIPAIAIGFALFFCLPDDINGTHYVSWRVLFVAVLFFVAGLEPTERFGRGSAIAFSTIVAVVLGIASTATAVSWSRTGQERQDMRFALTDIPDGSRIFYVQTDVPTPRERRAKTGTYHLAAYAVIERRALVQSMFTMPGQQPLRFRDPIVQKSFTAANRIDDIQTQVAGHLLPPAFLDHFDFVLGYGKSDASTQLPMPGQSMQLVRHVGNWRLFRLVQNTGQNGDVNSSPR